MSLQKLIEERAAARRKVAATNKRISTALKVAPIAWTVAKRVLIVSAALIGWTLWVVFSVVFGAFLSQNKVRGAIR